ncbi:hypothetical protein BFN03_18195 [Rhodococcus sp. WMMA185]|uniref:hypothetical protein n=1 Tax=Rhodococcus sp. WMMA185 TaxID=679318 RepID=UPI00087898D7|nr:hypothetical protein [Rhodococcus sp. WMMA185]AOW93941.1 hypothetical protein BFN03_18195 [Rhodococcus sp. WMMA185]
MAGSKSGAGRAIGLAATLAVVASCTTTEDPEDHGYQLTKLPPAAVGAVSVGPALPEAVDDRDWTTVFFFDEDGTNLGRVEGNAIHGNHILVSDRGIVSASSRAVTTLTDTSRTDTPMGHETIVRAAVNQPASGASTIWFDNGTGTSFVSIDADDGPTSSTVPGVVQTSAYCGNRSFAVVDESVVGTEGDPIQHGLYEILSDGRPVVRAQWEHPAEFRPAVVTSACSGDGQTILALYQRTETDDRTLGLVRITVSDGSRSETELEMPRGESNVRSGTSVAVDDRLYWISSEGNVLSAVVEGSPIVTQEWVIPDGDEIVASVHGTTVAVISYRGVPTFSEYDLRTGERTRGPIELPWLDDIIGSDTEAGGNFYSISHAVGLPAGL